MFASVAHIGQLVPVVVVASSDMPNRYVLIDGYKRVRALTRLRTDLVQVLIWTMPEADALVSELLMRRKSPAAPLEEAWLLEELKGRFGWSQDDLARRFGRSPSWVSERLGLVSTLPEAIQDQVRAGQISARGAMRCLVPFSRHDREECLKFAKAVGPSCLSSRELRVVYEAYRAAKAESAKQLILENPKLILRAREESTKEDPMPKSTAQLLAEELDVIAKISRRSCARLRSSEPNLPLSELRDCVRQTRRDLADLFKRLRGAIRA